MQLNPFDNTDSVVLVHMGLTPSLRTPYSAYFGFVELKIFSIRTY